MRSFYDYGFKDKIIKIDDGEYSERLKRGITISDMLLGDRHFKNRY